MNRALAKWAVIFLCAGTAGFWAAAQTSQSQRVLADWMPGGALLYLESADFKTNLHDWNQSAVNAEWTASKNHEYFLTTRLAIKLKDVYDEFSAAAGFAPTLNELETIAGSESALALYDFRRLDLLYITRLPAAQLGQNVLTRVRSDYESHEVSGHTYFIRHADDRVAAFATSGDLLLVSTREDLLTSALERLGGTAGASLSQESWYQDPIRARGAAPNGSLALRLVMDFAAVVKTSYFRSYWIQQNVDELRPYASVLADLTRTGNGFEEERVLVRAAQGIAPEAHVAATAELQRYIPDDAGLVRLWDTSSADFALELIRQKLFAAGSGSASARRGAPSAYADEFQAPAGDLRSRIDEPPKASLSGSLDLQLLKTILNDAGIQAVLHLESSRSVADAVFVSGDPVLGLRASSAWDAAAIRAALTGAVASYQTVSDVGLRWNTVTSGNRTLYQWDGLVPLTVYSEGQTLWLSRTPALLTSALNHVATAIAPQPGVYLARFNHRIELQPYLKLMRMLDLSDQSNHSTFFSENIGSLASALRQIQSVSVRVEDSPQVQRQHVRYELSR